MFEPEFLDSYSSFLEQNTQSSFLLLIVFGFAGGLISSLLPCILSLLPINLAYIGTLNIDNRIEALKKASQFVLGVVVVLTALGAFGSLAFAVFSQYRAEINIGVGLIIIIMSLSLFELIKLPLPQFIKSMPQVSPFFVGIIFALVSSPCSSPVLISVISIAANLESVFKSILLMFGYSLGYSAIIFFASLSAGLVKQLNWFKSNSSTVMKISAAVLMIIGIFYIYSGINNLG
jgi:cytochrome c-type biogenesis protein